MGNKEAKHHIDRAGVLGLVLAGGYSRRMEGPDKADMELMGQTLLSRAVACMAAQVTSLVISSNRPRPNFESQDIPIIADIVPNRPGPLAGLLSAMAWAAEAGTGAEWIFCLSMDTPLAPIDLLDELIDQYRAGDQALVARSNGRLHPTIGLYSLSLAPDLEKYLASGERKAVRWVDLISARIVDYGSVDPDPFFNVNTPEDFANLSNQNLEGT
jgi:molybdopterin-guanine dinucleotide biosynthesis protein A